MSEWNKLSWKLEGGDEEASGSITDGLWLRERHGAPARPSFRPRFSLSDAEGRVGCGTTTLAGLSGSH